MKDKIKLSDMSRPEKTPLTHLENEDLMRAAVSPCRSGAGPQLDTALGADPGKV